MIELSPMFTGAVNSPETFITAEVSETDTIITIQSATGFPNTDEPYLVVLGGGFSNAETVRVTGASGNTLTIERGYQGIAQSWPQGTTAAVNFTEAHYQALVGNINSLNEGKADKTAIATQEEAEAGVETTIRGWTAQRVRQAIDAVTTAISNMLTAHVDARNNPHSVTLAQINGAAFSHRHETPDIVPGTFSLGPWRYNARGAQNTTISTAGNLQAAFEVLASGTATAGLPAHPATICFHRQNTPNAHASFFGLDSDNQYKVGGWSLGATAFRIILDRPTAWVNAPLQNDATGMVRYRRNHMNEVEIIISVILNIAFNLSAFAVLPAGFRPTTRLDWNIAQHNSTAMPLLTVMPDGIIRMGGSVPPGTTIPGGWSINGTYKFSAAV